jgi:hypothetical protein
MLYRQLPFFRAYVVWAATGGDALRLSIGAQSGVDSPAAVGAG